MAKDKKKPKPTPDRGDSTQACRNCQGTGFSGVEPYVDDKGRNQVRPKSCGPCSGTGRR